jgi:biotin synthase
MIGVGPFIAHHQTPLGRRAEALMAEDGMQVPADELTTYKVVALTRILCPLTNLPSTTALATLNLAQGRELGLQRGANVVMPNVTPAGYRALYEIYPSKACINETAKQCHGCMRSRIESTGRTVGTGPGTSPNWLARHEQAGARN